MPRSGESAGGLTGNDFVVAQVRPLLAMIEDDMDDALGNFPTGTPVGRSAMSGVNGPA